MKQLLKNAKIYDGTGNDAFFGDILIEDDKIAQVGEGIRCDGAEVFDLKGLSVSSGFFEIMSASSACCEPSSIRSVSFPIVKIEMTE